CPLVCSDDDMNEEGWSRRQKAAGVGNPKNSYRISDYFSTDPEYGTDEDVEAFVKEAHRLGLRVMFDLVYMHCGPNAVFIKEHPDFVKRDENGNVMLTVYNFPIINFESEGLREYLYENMTYFVKRFDIDGYRCDVGDACPLDFWEEGSRRVREIKPEFIMLNEGRKADFVKSCFDANYGLDWTYALRDVFNGKKDVNFLRERWHTDNDKLPKEARQLRGYENHDIANDAYDERLDVRLGGAAGELATVVNFMMDGIPILYNGNEIADYRRHSFFSTRFHLGRFYVDWSVALTERGKRRLALTKKLTELRHTDPVLYLGKTAWITTDKEDQVLAFTRSLGGETYVVLGNFTEETVACSFKIPVGAVETVLESGAAYEIGERLNAWLNPYGYIVLKVK
ncbi:MAG: alpha-glucosidase C-terminal domain-containing protein, partial [Clostridia bacterium]|nr:alpha-glucosidase C-terminal domain-containing protein [Clostridia bacterium]